MKRVVFLKDEYVNDVSEKKRVGIVKRDMLNETDYYYLYEREDGKVKANMLSLKDPSSDDYEKMKDDKELYKYYLLDDNKYVTELPKGIDPSKYAEVPNGSYDIIFEGKRYEVYSDWLFNMKLEVVEDDRFLIFAIIYESYYPMIKKDKDGNYYGFPIKDEENHSLVFNKKTKQFHEVLRESFGGRPTNRTLRKVSSNYSLNTSKYHDILKEPFNKIGSGSYKDFVNSDGVTVYDYYKERVRHLIIDKPWKEDFPLISLSMAHKFPAILHLGPVLSLSFDYKYLTDLNKKAFKNAKSLDELFKMNKLPTLTRKEKKLLLIDFPNFFKGLFEDQYRTDGPATDIMWYYFTIIIPFVDNIDKRIRILESLLGFFHKNYSKLENFYMFSSYDDTNNIVLAMNSMRENKLVNKSGFQKSLVKFTKGLSTEAKERVALGVVADAVFNGMSIKTEDAWSSRNGEDSVKKLKEMYKESYEDLSNLTFGSITYEKFVKSYQYRDNIISVTDDVIDMHDDIMKALEDSEDDETNILIKNEVNKVIKDSFGIFDLHDKLVEVHTKHGDYIFKNRKDVIITLEGDEILLEEEFKNGELKFEVAKNTSLLTSIGLLLSICIGSEGYKKKLLSKEFFYIIIKRNESIEAVLEISNNQSGRRLLQAKGKFNNISFPLELDVQESIFDYCERHNIAIDDFAKRDLNAIFN